MHALKSILILVAVFSAQESNGQFTTVINVPPEVAPESIDSDTQLNLMDGGVLTGDSASVFQVGSPDGTSQNVELNIFGGEAPFLDVYAGAVLNMSGGLADDFLAFEGSTVNFSDGNLLGGFSSRADSILNISGGIFSRTSSISGDANISAGLFPEGSLLEAQAGSDVHINGGSFMGLRDEDLDEGVGRRDASVAAQRGSRVVVNGGLLSSLGVFGADATITGGTLSLLYATGATSRVSGGTFSNGVISFTGNFIASGGEFDGYFYANQGANIELVGTEFLIDGEAIDGLLEPGDSVVVNDRGGALLSGILSDGSAFDFMLNEVLVDEPFASRTEDYFSQSATLKLTLVPEPTTAVLMLCSLAIGMTQGRR